MVSAWVSSQRLVMGQIKVNEKSSEITAIPKLLDILCLKGCIVTIDAIGCQRHIVRKIVDNSGDYVITLKKNQNSLYQKVEKLFQSAIINEELGISRSSIYLLESAHSRDEVRHYVLLSNVQELIDPEHKWESLNSIGMVNLTRVDKVTGKTTFKTRYFISSLPNNVELFAQAVGKHWNIENQLHWVLDVAFREDDSRIRKDNGPQNFGVLRRIALNILNQENTLKKGIRRKRNKAGWDDNYLEEVLGGIV